MSSVSRLLFSFYFYHASLIRDLWEKNTNYDGRNYY